MRTDPVQQAHTRPRLGAGLAVALAVLSAYSAAEAHPERSPGSLTASIDHPAVPAALVRVAQQVSEPAFPPPADTAPARSAPPVSSMPAKKPNYWSRRRALFALSRIETAPVVMLGDSLTERAQWSEISGCRLVANRGIGGDDSAGLLRRTEDVTRLKPAAVFIMIGINDILSGTPTGTIASNVEQVVGLLTERGARVYLTQVLPVRDSFRKGEVNRKVDELSEAYRRLGELPHVSLIDFRAAMRGPSGGIRQQYTTDGVHLSPAGYRVWRDAVAPIIAKYCSATADPDEMDAKPAGGPAGKAGTSPAPASVPARPAAPRRAR